MSVNKFDPELDIDGSGQTNGKRAMRAACSILEFLGKDKADTKEDGTVDYETHMQDLLSDLQHLADREGFDFGEVLEMATRRHDEEINPESAL